MASWGEAIVGFVGDVYKAAVPANARAYIKGVMGDQTPIDESFFSEAELNALRKAASSGWRRWSEGQSSDFMTIEAVNDLDELKNFKVSSPEHLDKYYEMVEKFSAAHGLDEKQVERLMRPNLVPSIQYDDYEDGFKKGGRPKQLIDMLVNPAISAQTTIGRARIERSEDGSTILTDRYKFNSGEAERGNSMFARLDRLGERLIPPERGFDVRVNLGDSIDWPSTWKPDRRPPDSIDLSRFTQEDLTGKPSR